MAVVGRVAISAKGDGSCCRCVSLCYIQATNYHDTPPFHCTKRKRRKEEEGGKLSSHNAKNLSLSCGKSSHQPKPWQSYNDRHTNEQTHAHAHAYASDECSYHIYPPLSHIPCPLPRFLPVDHPVYHLFFFPPNNTTIGLCAKDLGQTGGEGK